MAKKFHPSGLAVCYHERKIEFDFIFQATKSGIDQKLFKNENEGHRTCRKMVKGTNT